MYTIRSIPPQLKWKVKSKCSRMKSEYLTNTQHSPTHIFINIYGVMAEGSINSRIYCEYIMCIEKKISLKMWLSITGVDETVLPGNAFWNGWLSFSECPLFCSISGVCLIPSFPKTDCLGDGHGLKWCSQGEKSPHCWAIGSSGGQRWAQCL